MLAPSIIYVLRQLKESTAFLMHAPICALDVTMCFLLSLILLRMADGFRVTDLFHPL